MRLTKIFPALATLALLSACAEQPQPTFSPTSTTITIPTRVEPTITPTFAPKSTLSYRKVESNARYDSNEQWMAIGIAQIPEKDSGNDQYNVRLILTDTKSKTLLQKNLFDKWEKFDLDTYTLPQPIRWSLDNNYLYFTDRFNPLIDCGIYTLGSTIKKIEVNTVDVANLVSVSGKNISLAPDEKTVAYIKSESALKLGIINLDDGKERFIELKNTNAQMQAGNIVWSLDSSVIMLTLVNNPCKPDQFHIILRVDLNTMSQKEIIKGDKRMTTCRWEERGLVMLCQGSSFLWLDPVTFQLIDNFMPIASYFHTSPNKKWTAIVLPRSGFEAEKDSKVKLINIGNNQSWTVSRNEPFTKGNPWLDPIHWSKDGKYIYLATTIGGDPGLCPYGYIDVYRNLNRADLTDGSFAEIAEGSAIYKISPNDRYLASVRSAEKPVFIIRDFFTGIWKQLVVEGNSNKYTLIDSVTWSPDSKSLLFLTVRGVCGDEGISIEYLDTTTLSQKTLVKDAKQISRIREWADTNMVYLKDLKGNDLLMNPQTGEINPNSNPAK